MIDIVERWEKTRLLQGVPTELKAEMAFVFENQIIHNNHIKESNNISAEKFRRLSVPLARRVFPVLESHKHYKVSAKPYLESSIVADLGVPGVWHTNTQRDDSKGWATRVLDLEAKQTATLAETLKKSVDSFIRSQAPFKVFHFQCFGTNDKGNVTLYYDLE